MLAFDDAALARLFIAATAIDPDERDLWLRQLAKKFEGRSRMAEASRRQRERAKNGQRFYHLCLDQVSVEELLIAEGLLPPGREYARTEVEAALTDFIQALFAIRGELNPRDGA